MRGVKYKAGGGGETRGNMCWQRNVKREVRGKKERKEGRGEETCEDRNGVRGRSGKEEEE